MKLHRTLFTAWVFAAGVALHAQNAHNMVVQTNKPALPVNDPKHLKIGLN